METINDLLSSELPFSETIIQRNLQMMRTEMVDLLSGESLGVNAGHVVVHGRKCPCMAANCIVEASSGGILDFTNHRFAHGMEGEEHVILRIAYDGDRSGIVEWIGEGLQGAARGLMQECIDRWNAEKAILWGRLGE